MKPLTVLFIKVVLSHVIDIYNKYVWVIPLTNKKSKTMAKATKNRELTNMMNSITRQWER